MHPNGLIILDPADTVAVVLSDMATGETREGITAREPISRGHKIARQAMKLGEPVIKYGQLMGVASKNIAIGDHVHVKNCGVPDDHPTGNAIRGELPASPDRTTFLGYSRPDGRVGTRNYIGVMASVNCSTTVCHAIAAEANRALLPLYQGLDGFVPIVHDQGCGMSSTGEGFDVLVRTLKGYRDHPNFGGMLIIGLGCEVNQLTLWSCQKNWH